MSELSSGCDVRSVVIRNAYEEAGKYFTFKKNKPSAFSNADFQKVLEKHNIKEVFIVGSHIKYDIIKTAEDAISRGYHVVLSENLVTSILPFPGDPGLMARVRLGFLQIQGLSDNVTLPLDDSCTKAREQHQFRVVRESLEKSNLFQVICTPDRFSKMHHQDKGPGTGGASSTNCCGVDH